MSELLCDRPLDGVARLLINRPEARNAMDAAVRRQLRDGLVAARADPSVGAVLIGGANAMFCAGGDLPSMVGLSAEAASARMQDGHALVEALWHFPKPVVVAIERFAIGAGAGLALLADHAVIGESAVIGLPFLRLGLVPDYGLMTTLPWRAGPALAARAFRDALTLDANTALSHGLADEVAADTGVAARALDVAARLARLPLQAFARMKRALRTLDLRQALADERAEQVACLTGAEFAEGYEAFRGKRAPEFNRRP